MPSVLKIDPRRRIVCSSFYGEVDDEELLRHRARIEADPDFNPGFSEIVDFSGVTLPAISEARLAGMASGKSIFDGSVMHVVVTPADLPYKLARKYQVLARQTRPNLFIVRSLAEAYKLLGFEPDTGINRRTGTDASSS
jgi:hypothetical protein